MENLAGDIAFILQDYHNYNGFNFDSTHVLKWVEQFAEHDQVFILEEFLHLLKQGIYVSEENAKQILISSIENLSTRFKFKNVDEFLHNVDFLRLQNRGKSQDILLNLLNTELLSKYSVDIKDCGKKSKKYAIYIDDIIATGGTIFRDSLKWLKLVNHDKETNLEKVMNGDIVFIANVLCKHDWANPGWRLKLELKREVHNKIQFVSFYKIENHPSMVGQRFNFAYPLKNQPKEVLDYFNALSATSKSENAFRKDNMPRNETFFSSKENRMRFENVILKKGIEILSKNASLKLNHRPLGAVTPSYKTLGTGTIFFTWRNISNTTPIVFWWAPANNIWYPLFPLINRGLGNSTF